MPLMSSLKVQKQNTNNSYYDIEKSIVLSQKQQIKLFLIDPLKPNINYMVIWILFVLFFFLVVRVKSTLCVIVEFEFKYVVRCH